MIFYWQSDTDMKKSCIFTIHEKLQNFSAKEKLIATYIAANPADAVDPSIEELAERIGVSESTLFRFVRKLGYDGYQQFRIALATETAGPGGTVYEVDEASLEGKGTIPVVFKTNVAALEATMAKLNPRDLSEVAERFIAADRVLLFGLGGSALVAQDAFHKLVRTGVTCIAPLDFHMQLMLASQATASDCALVVSHTGSNKDALALADELRSRGTPLVVLTDSGRSPLTKLGDIVLRVHTASSRYAMEAFSARLVQLAIVDCLYVELMERLGPQAISALERMREVISKRRT